MSEVRTRSGAAFLRFVKRTILASYQAGFQSWSQILLGLPSIYPSTALQAIIDLGQEAAVPASWVELIRAESRMAANSVCHEAYVCHPLDFDWRFDPDSADLLLALAWHLTELDQSVALLGAPTLFRRACENQLYERNLILIEKNESAPVNRSESTRGEAIAANLMTDRITGVQASLAVADPPWYPEYISAFLWAASQILFPGGHLLMVLPPIGTRPGISSDWKRVLQAATECGFQLERKEALLVRYVSPLYERNALRAEGITNYPSLWRRGDMAVFSKIGNNRFAFQPQLMPEEGWREVLVEEVRWRIHCAAAPSPGDCLLRSIVEGDVLPTVSRRDARRAKANVWTSGNRVYTSNDPVLLADVLTSLSHPGVRRVGDKSEVVERTILQARQIVSLEMDELRAACKMGREPAAQSG